MTSAASPSLVSDAGALEALCSTLTDQAWIAVDTEFLREDTYFPRLCLIQVACPGIVACVDPLALTDLGPLLDILYREDITKVFHAASQDLEIFFHLRGHVPIPIFDTQVAAPLLGHPEQMGYANLVKSVLDITLDKGHSRTDWSRRPLSAAQLHYAADDVIYLGEVYQRLRDQLVSQGRLDWLADDFARLADPKRYQPSPVDAWKRLRAAQRLKGKKLAVLQRLAAWREEQALHHNRPRGWIVRDDALLDMAHQLPSDRQSLSHIRGLARKVLDRDGATLLELIATAIQEGPTELPEQTTKEYPVSGQDEALVDILTAVLRLRCEEREMNPASVASRKDLQRLAGGNHDLPIMRGWRYEIAGRSLLALLEGELSIQIRDRVPALVG